MAHCHIAEHLHSGTMLHRRPGGDVVTAPVEPYEVVIVGAGQAGLAAAWHLRRQGLRFLILEAAEELGHTWRTRWESPRLFTPAEHDALPCLPFPAPAGKPPHADASHAGLLDEEHGAQLWVRAIEDVVQVTRTGTPLPPH